MIYQWVCKKSNTTSVTSGIGTAYPSGAPESATPLPQFLHVHCISGIRVVHDVMRCDVHYKFRIKTMLGS